MRRLLFLLGCACLFGGCINVKLQPVEAHITVDVNVKVDKALDDFFGDIDKKAATLATPEKS
jgi:hypothetical protein